MQSLRSFLVISTAIVALGVLAPVASAGSQKPFHLEKVCDIAAGRCVVTASTFDPIPAGTEINYSGMNPDDLQAVLTIKNGSATGQCSIGSVFEDLTPGTCVFAAGTGRLTQFHLDAAVTLDGEVWSWEGWYSFGNRS